MARGRELGLTSDYQGEESSSASESHIHALTGLRFISTKTTVCGIHSASLVAKADFVSRCSIRRPIARCN